MPKRIDYQAGEAIGVLIFIKDTITTTKNRKALFRCKCGKEFIACIPDAKNGSVKSCGCYRSEYSRPATHRLSKHPSYHRFIHMMNRCYKSEHEWYHRYGGRGITVEEYLQDVRNYIEYIDLLPNAYEEGLSIDRINNSLGYIRGNLRWASASTQTQNRG